MPATSISRVHAAVHKHQRPWQKRDTHSWTPPCSHFNASCDLVLLIAYASVYGVTFIGARKQIQRQLKDKKLFDTNSELYKASQYLARVTIKCIGDLFYDAN